MFAKILRKLRNDRNLSQGELANIIGVSKSTIGMYEQGNRVPKADATLKKIADYFGCSTDYLLGREEMENIASIGVPYDASDTVKIPVYGNVSAGKGIFADDNIIGYESAESSDIVPGEEYFYLTVHGNSMFPMFLENDYILVKKQSSVDSGSFAVVLVDDTEAKVKKIVYGDDWIELQSVNPMYEPEPYKGPDVLRIRILGLVKGMKRKF